MDEMDLLVVDYILSSNQNDTLAGPITNTEIEEAVYQIQLEKAPELDGFPSLFIHHFQPIIKLDILEAIKYMFMMVLHLLLGRTLILY